MLRCGLAVLVIGLAAVSVLWNATVVARPDDRTPGEKEQTMNDAEKQFTVLRDAYVAKYQPLQIQAERTWWDANINGRDEDFKRAEAVQKRLVDLHGNREVFEALKKLRDAGQVKAPWLRRELELMYLAHLGGQGDRKLQERIVELQSEVEKLFNTYRAEVAGKTLTENELRAILAETKDSAAAEAAWKAYMAVGSKVQRQLGELVTLRNRLARELGFDNYFSMRIFLDEIDEAQMWRLFDDLDRLTREPFAKMKQQIDADMAARFGIDAAALRPWHYGEPFFQELAGAPDDGLEAVYKQHDLLALAKAYYAGLELPVEEILARSDLYEKPSKCPHAFAADIDRAGDIRILCNLRPNLYWMDTLLHELGHAVYDVHIDQSVPYILHKASHGITTEGIALMFGAMSKNADWLTRALKLPPEEAGRLGSAAWEHLRAEKLLFARWAQVMVRFEHGMYAKPDQDLGKLWWDLKRQYQLLNPPQDVHRPDYAAKIHVVTVPVYYHNYMMGDLFACQVQHYIAANIVKVGDPTATSFYGRKDVGAYLRSQVFGPGSLVDWRQLTELATGEPLSAAYFAEQFIRGGKRTS